MLVRRNSKRYATKVAEEAHRYQSSGKNSERERERAVREMLARRNFKRFATEAAEESSAVTPSLPFGVLAPSTGAFRSSALPRSKASQQWWRRQTRLVLASFAASANLRAFVLRSV